MMRPKFLLAIAGALVISLMLPLLGLPRSAYTQLPAVEISQPPPPPSAPPPNGTRPGGGLEPEDSACSALNEDLQALIPVENPVLTATAYPTILFYVPFGAEEVEYGEFSLLQWPAEDERLYQTRFRLPESPGIVSVTLPNMPTHALAEGQIYRWYFQLYCAGGAGIQPDLTLHGAIQRVALTPRRAQQVQSGAPDIWYDTLAQVAEALQTSPQDTQLRNQWQSLLALIEAEAVEDAAFVGPVLPLEE
ncbi:MAG: DUF928 domain-containing protein [Cyanobacteria bacterium P01_D01_bin.44]